MKWRLWTITLTTLTFMAIACGSGGATAKPAPPQDGTSTSTTKAPPAGHMTAQEIATKLAPLGCNATPSAPSTMNLGDIKPVTSLECTISGENVSIDEYVNAQQVSHNLQLARTTGCQIAKQFGVTEAFYVIGPNWLIQSKTVPTATSIRKAIGFGLIGTLKC
jgi:hypothetical protein